MATRPTSFHSFTKLPQGLRDEIWRQCLPRRVVEIDMPDDSFILNEDFEFEFETLKVGGVPTPEFTGCHMQQTTMINNRPPIISRVCRESRNVALKTGAMLDITHMPWAHGGADLIDRIRKQWVHHGRHAVVHLHYNTRSDGLNGRVKAQGNLVSLLRNALVQGGTGSVSKDFLTTHHPDGWKETMDSLEEMRRVMVCRRVVCIHVDAEPAMQSGLFGRLGEERVVMVDALDEDRISRFRDLWNEHGSVPDVITDDFFCAARSGQEWQSDLDQILVSWLRDRWYEKTGWWVTELLPRGRTRHV